MINPAEPERTEWEELKDIRTALTEIRARHGSWTDSNRTIQSLDTAITIIGWAMMEQCPHDRDTWRVNRDIHVDGDWEEICDACDSTHYHSNHRYRSGS